MPSVSILSNIWKRAISRRLRFGRVACLLSGLLLVLLLPGCSIIEDQLNLVPKAPSAEVKQLAQSTTMTPLAQRLFYRQQPTLEPPSMFWEQCKVPHGNIVLGCYIEEKKGAFRKRSKIVIQNVIDPKFSGTMEVTAAHEMLHAAYARLEKQQREEIFQQLHAARQQVENPRLLNLLANYETQGKDRYGHELYAHLGTELEDLGNPALEEHYKQYFRDRQKVVTFATESVRVVAKFEKQADDLEVKIGQLEQQLVKSHQGLQKIESRINQLSAKLQQQQQKLQRTQASVNSAPSQAKANHLVAKVKREQSAYNRQVKNYNHQVKQQKKSIARFNQLVKDYRQKVEAYNQLAWRRWKTMENFASQA